MTTLLDVDIPGLDLVLGGGIRVLQRRDGAEKSATLLIRGPAGSGKTILGTQLAASIARKLQTDVAYGCVELLPVELRAQHEAVRGKTFNERVVPLGEALDTSNPGGSYVHIYAGLLDLGEEGQAVERFGDALELLLQKAEKRSGRPIRVLVVDSLTDGYGLGAGAPRILADGISKLAADAGLVIILLEETVDQRPSVWSFSVDTVFELGLVETGGRLQRRLWIPKNRLGLSVPGPHLIAITSLKGMEIFPREDAYRGEAALQVLGVPSSSESLIQPWALKGLDATNLLTPFRLCVTAVIGRNSTAVRRLALRVGASVASTDSEHSIGKELFFQIGRMGPNYGLSRPRKPTRLRIGLPFMDPGASFLNRLRRALNEAVTKQSSPRRVLIGDLRDIQYHADAQGMLWSISTAAALLRELRIPLVLFETVESLNSRSVALSQADVAITYDDSPIGAGMRVEDFNTSTVTKVDGTYQQLVKP